MLYDSSNKILKNGSLTSKVYFLLLKSPLTIYETMLQDCPQDRVTWCADYATYLPDYFDD